LKYLGAEDGRNYAKDKVQGSQKSEKPTGVSFKTAGGEKVRFTARKTVKVPITVSFKAKKKK
jgi:hypothetical protein